jgi:hypothetical protein
LPELPLGRTVGQHNLFVGPVGVVGEQNGFAKLNATDVNQEPRLRKVAAEQLVRNVIHEDGGSLIHNGREDEQRSFDSTCRKFYRFLTQPLR